MNWGLVAAGAELVGTLAVIVSLVYVARQVRQSNALARAQALQMISLEIARVYSSWSHDDRAMELLHGIMYDGTRRPHMAPGDMMKMSSNLLAVVRIYDAAYRSMKSGIISEADFEAMMLPTVFRIPFVVDSWASWQPNLSRDFVAHMETRFPHLANEAPS